MGPLFMVLEFILSCFVSKQIQVLTGPVYAKVKDKSSEKQPAPTLAVNRLRENAVMLLLESNEKLCTNYFISNYYFLLFSRVCYKKKKSLITSVWYYETLA